MKSNFSKDELLAAYETLTSQKYDTPPEGFRTVRQIAIDWSCSIPHARKIVRTLVREGKAESRKYRLRGERAPVPHYGLKKRA